MGMVGGAWPRVGAIFVSPDLVSDIEFPGLSSDLMHCIRR